MKVYLPELIFHAQTLALDYFWVRKYLSRKYMKKALGHKGQKKNVKILILLG